MNEPRSRLFRRCLVLGALSAALVAACTSSPSGGNGSGGASATGSGGAGTSGSGGRAAGSGGASATGSGGTAGGSGGTAVAGSGGASTTGSGGAAAGSGGAAGGGSGGAGSGGRSGGSGGSGGMAAGSGGMGASCAAGAPTPAAGGAAFPFPQHRARPYCLYPQTCNDADVMTGWQMYKSRLIVDGGNGTLRVQRPENQNDTVSEGIAYGMLYAVYMNEKDTFDKLWAYTKAHLDMRGLMNWHINANGTTATGGANSATDSDEDMAFALVMADKQWGGYTTVAKDFIALVAMHDFQADGTIRGGDTYNAVNPSYLAPAFYREFAAYTGEARWTTILDKSYETLAAVANATTGLVPDWSAGRTGPNYLYDATRTPYRVALDACWNNEPRAVAFSQKIGMFFAGVGVANIVDGYNLMGQPTGQNFNSTFVGPAGAAGMVIKHVTLVTDAYAKVAMDGRMGTESYYNLSWALFTSMLMTGNFFNMSSPP